MAALQRLLDTGALAPGTFDGQRVETAVRAAGEFYPAQAAHQQYLEKNPGGYCNHRTRFQWPHEGSGSKL